MSVTATLAQPDDWQTAAQLDAEMTRPLPPLPEPRDADAEPETEDAAQPAAAPTLPYGAIIRGQCPDSDPECILEQPLTAPKNTSASSGYFLLTVSHGLFGNWCVSENRVSNRVQVAEDAYQTDPPIRKWRFDLATWRQDSEQYVDEVFAHRACDRQISR